MTLHPQAALWATVLAFGIYHGLNPAMGWPLAVANGLYAKRGAAVFATVLPLGAGHFLAMAIVLVPFALLDWVLRWSDAIRVGAGLLVLLFGVYKLVLRRHPRFLARVRPTHLAWWSFLMATAHGAGLMLLPIALSLCRQPSAGASQAGVNADALPALGHAALERLLLSGVGTAIAVSMIHTLAMVLAGVTVAWAVYRYLGLGFVRRAWFNLDAAWGASLVLAGAASTGMALFVRH